jgi:hypothetical protein
MKSFLSNHLLPLVLLLAAPTWAQIPTGAIAGRVTDASGAVVAKCPVTIVNGETGARRSVETDSSGAFSASALPAGTYEIVLELRGFRRMSTKAAVEAGNTTTVDLVLQVGETKQSVTVAGVAPQLNYESNMVQGVVHRQQIELLPLNGRDALQLAVLEPGVSVSPAGAGLLNRRFYVDIMGGDQAQTRITVDGISITDAIDGGEQQAFSMEAVQEFQVSTANPDPSFGYSSQGAVSIVSRSGSNDFHGGAYFFYRDHNLAAYPALVRDPTNPNPFFARRQPGASLGGPIVKSRLLFFVNVEHMNQVSAMRTQPSDPALAAFAQTNSSPYSGTLLSTRLDYQLNQKNNLFLRYSHDGNLTFGPRGQGPLPSNWFVNKNWADQSVLGWTTTVSPTMVNDFRSAYTYWRNDNRPPDASRCPDCLGLGGPEMIIGGGVTIGNNHEVPEIRNERHIIFTDNYTWQKASQRIRFGGEWDHGWSPGLYDFYDPASINVYSPTAVQQYNATAPPDMAIPIPSTFTTLDDLLALPLSTIQIGIGDPGQPAPFQRNRAIGNDRYRFYAQDVWRVNAQLSLSFGFALERENNLLNYDIPKPAYLQPILGASGTGFGPAAPWRPAPSLGFAWSPGTSGKTVIRGGVSIQNGTFPISNKLTDRAYEGPIGNGRVPLPGDVVPNPIPGIPGVPQGTPLAFPDNPTMFNSADLLAILPPVQVGLAQMLASFGDPNSLAVRTIDVFKSAAGDALLPNNFKVLQTQGFNLGAQRQLKTNLAVTADFVWRHSIRGDIDDQGVDLNRWLRASGPVIPPCDPSQEFDPTAECSLGPIPVRESVGNSRYAALLLKVDKRFSRRYQFLASYALQDLSGTNGIWDLDNWFASWGPIMPRNAFNLSGIVTLPWRFQLSAISAFSSRSPMTVYISGIDLSGGGVNQVVLPGSHNGDFNINLHESDLPALVSKFNQQYAGTVTPAGQVVPTITLPSTYFLGANFFSQDLRLAKNFVFFKERLTLSAFAEAFNLFNNSNPGGTVTDLRSLSFGQFTSKENPLSGSGGPRCFQLGARVTF